MARKNGKTTELVLHDASDYALLKITEERRAELMAAGLGDGQLSVNELDRAAFGDQGAEHFVIQTLTGPENVDCIEGVILGQRKVRVFWAGQKIGEGPPPCSSGDLEHGKGEPGGDCEACPYAQWGSDLKGGKGQACQTRHIVFLAVPGSLLPLVLNLPPTSLRNVRDFFRRLASNNHLPHEIVTKVTVKKRDGDNGPFGTAVFTGGNPLTPEAAARFKQVADDLAKHVRGAATAVAASGGEEAGDGR